MAMPALALALILAGCTAADVRDQVDAEAGEDGDRLAALALVTRRDVEAAAEAARILPGGPDQMGVMCWAALAPMVEAAGAYREAAEQLEAGGSGYALRLQRARGVRLLMQRARDGRLAPCAAMLGDSRDTLGRLLRGLGVLL